MYYILAVGYGYRQYFLTTRNNIMEDKKLKYWSTLLGCKSIANTQEQTWFSFLSNSAEVTTQNVALMSQILKLAEKCS